MRVEIIKFQLRRKREDERECDEDFRQDFWRWSEQ